MATLHPLQALLMRHGWSKASTQRVWAAGPVDGLPGCGTCLLVNAATGVANLPAIRDSIVSAFQQVCASGGVLANQRLRGVRFDITDAKVHSDGRECMCVCVCVDVSCTRGVSCVECGTHTHHSTSRCLTSRGNGKPILSSSSAGGQAIAAGANVMRLLVCGSCASNEDIITGSVLSSPGTMWS